MQYNKNKHLTLLKDSPKLKGPKTSFSYEEFLKLLESRPDENFFELEAYSAMLIYHLHWENREQYFELIAKLLNGPINFLEPNPKCEGFDDLIDELVSLFDRYCPDPSLRESHEFSEEELRDLVQNIVIKMKEYYPEDSKDNL